MGRQPLPDEGGLDKPFVMPAKAGIQYAVTPELTIGCAEYWIIHFRG
jgi:hypothetical protein